MDEEIDLIEVEMNEDEIDELIAQLVELKESKTNTKFSIASDMDLIVNYDTTPKELEEELDDN